MRVITASSVAPRRPDTTAGMPTTRQPQQARPARRVVRARPTPAVPADAEAMAVSSASCARRVPIWTPVAPKATNSAAPSVRSTIDAARSPRTWAKRDSLRRDSVPVSQGTTVPARSRATARTIPAAGSIHHRRTTVSPSDQGGDAEGRDDPDDQILEGVDVLHDAGQQVAPPERRQTGGGQPLQPLVHLDPEVGQQPEGRVVTDQTLLVPEETAGQAEELDADDGDGQHRLVGVLRPPSR